MSAEIENAKDRVMIEREEENVILKKDYMTKINYTPVSPP